MRRLRARPVARVEIVSAFEWYAIRSPEAARRFLAAVDETMNAIEESPER